MEEYQDLKLLLNEIFKERRIDFSQYREKLLQRRVAVRLRVTKNLSYEKYMEFLENNREEMDALLDVLTINVTQFFRDTKVFEAVKTKIIPELFTPEVIQKKKIIRIWSCGCSGGEEAATILILIAEYLKNKLNIPRIHIYGTDIDKWSVERAKDGVKEAGNILTGSYLSAMSQMVSFKLALSVPRFAFDLVGFVIEGVLDEIMPQNEKCLSMVTEFIESNHQIKGYFVFLPKKEALEKILKGLNV